MTQNNPNMLMEMGNKSLGSCHHFLRWSEGKTQKKMFLQVLVQSIILKHISYNASITQLPHRSARQIHCPAQSSTGTRRTKKLQDFHRLLS